jgi:hypothetical protein
MTSQQQADDMLNQFVSDKQGIPALHVTPLDAQRAIVRALEDDCRRERRLIDHWAYDLPLHMQLYSRLKSARAELARLERGI